MVTAHVSIYDEAASQRRTSLGTAIHLTLERRTFGARELAHLVDALPFTCTSERSQTTSTISKAFLLDNSLSS